MNIRHSFFAASMFLALAGAAGCNDSDNTDDGKAISSVDINPEKATVSEGSSLQFHATATYADGSTKDVTSDSDTVWNTSDPDVATVSEDGLVSAVKPGLVDITAEYKSEEASESFAVMP